MLLLLLFSFLAKGHMFSIPRSSITHRLIHHHHGSQWLKLSSTLKPSTSETSPTSSSSSIDTIPSLSDFDLPTNSNNKNLLCIRHSTAHIMAMAVQKLFPQARTAIGPWTDNGYVIIIIYLFIYLDDKAIIPLSHASSFYIDFFMISFHLKNKCLNMI